MQYKNNTAAVVQARHGTSAQTFAPHRTQRFSTSELCKAGELASSTVCGARYSQETDETTWEENDGADDTAHAVLLGHVVVARGTEVHHCATTPIMSATHCDLAQPSAAPTWWYSVIENMGLTILLVSFAVHTRSGRSRWEYR